MDEDEYDADTEMDDPLDGEPDHEDEPDEPASQVDEFTGKDAFLAGSFASWAYEEGRRKRLLKEQSKRRKRKKFSDDDSD